MTNRTTLDLVARPLATVLVAASAWLMALRADTAELPPPNIVWISAEDISPHLACYGDPHAITPHLDDLAAGGIRFTRAFTTAGVCAPCRSGIITGIYQTTLGTHHMRCRAKLPASIRPFPSYLREAGYYCTNNSKEDYQFDTPPGSWDASSRVAHWRNRPSPETPFFAVFNFTGCHESGIARDDKYRAVTASLSDSQRQDAATLTTLPPYYPDTPATREDWKRNYELITAMDAWAGNLIADLAEDRLLDRTIIMFWSDHGVGLPRAKRWLYDSGTHVPLIVYIPEAYRVPGQAEPGTTNVELVSSIDLAPTVLRLAGVEVPDFMQGQPFLGPRRPASRQYVYGARDRMDERYDIIRMVRDQQFKYLRNYEPLKTYYQYMNTAEQGATMRELRRLHRDGNLPVAAAQCFAPHKRVEELYDTQADPHEIHNLAGDPNYAATLQRLRQAHLDWVRETKDLGLLAEPILARRAGQSGDTYGVLRGVGGDDLADRIAATAVAASAGPEAMGQLVAALDDPDAAVRYWAATGLGNLGRNAASAHDQLIPLLQRDPSPAVQIAAARAICLTGGPVEKPLVVLGVHLAEGRQWERLQAAIVLDELNAQADAAKPALRAALRPRPELFAGGKYTVRVVNRALNELEGTARDVK